MPAPLLISMGDPAGIGPEIAVKAWDHLRARRPFFWIGDPANGLLNVVGDANLAILRLFNAEGIEIPFPQRNLNIRFTDAYGPLEEALEEEGIPPELASRIRAAAERRRRGAQNRPADPGPGSGDDELG